MPRIPLLFAGALLLLPGGSAAQVEARLRVEENFRREPNGVVLGRLRDGSQVRVLGTEGQWSRVELAGWVWLRSLQMSDDAEFDLIVSEQGGENLRAGPSGDVLGRLAEGVLLEEVARDPAWAQVRRVGWVWSASVETAPDTGPMIQPPAPDARPAAPESQPGASTPPPGFTTVGSAGGAILAGPGGDTVALASPGSDVAVVGREGNWARVRVDGWMWIPEDGPTVEAPGTPVALAPSDLTAAPQENAGRVVAWTLQYVSLERAEAVRTDFFEGEPFLLTRFGGSEGPFVYVALPPDRLSEVEGLVPLETVQVTARVRTGASALTGTPIVDLLTLERARDRP